MSTLFFRNRHLLTLSIVVLLVGGLSAAFTLPRLEDPRIRNRAAVIVTALPGASAERVEALVTKKLEDELATFKEENAGKLPELQSLNMQIIERLDREKLELD